MSLLWAILSVLERFQHESVGESSKFTEQDFTFTGNRILIAL
jgi:hypothetical protein